MSDSQSCYGPEDREAIKGLRRLVGKKDKIPHDDVTELSRQPTRFNLELGPFHRRTALASRFKVEPFFGPNNFGTGDSLSSIIVTIGAVNSLTFCYYSFSKKCDIRKIV